MSEEVVNPVPEPPPTTVPDEANPQEEKLPPVLPTEEVVATSDEAVPVPVEHVDEYEPHKFVGRDDELPIIIVGPDNEEIFPEDILVAPDGGWGWLIVFAAFMSNLIVDGSVYTFGTLLVDIVKSAKNTAVEDKATESQVAWVGSIQAGFYLILGPFVSSLSNAIGFRATAIAGSIISFCAYTMTWFLNQDGDKEGPNMDTMFVFFGFLSGLGFCLIYFPSVIMVGYYFEKRRALATGIAVCGSGFGTFVYAALIDFLLEELKWPKTILVEGFLVLTCAGFACLYRPLRPIQRDKNIDKDTKVILPASGSVTHVVVRTEGDLKPGMSLLNATAPSGIIVMTNSPSGGISTFSRTTVPNGSLIAGSRTTVGTVGDMKEVPELSNPIRQQSQLSRSGPDQVDEELSAIGSNSQLMSARSTTTTVTLVVPPSEANLVESRVFRVASKNTLNKPLYRSHIFYPGDLEKISEEENAPNVEWEAVPVQTVPSRLPGEEEIPAFVPKSRKTRFLKFFKSSILSKMLDLSLMKSTTFLILGFSGLFAFSAFFIPFTYLKKFAIESNCSDNEATALIAIIGVSNTVGRVFCGFLADRLKKYVLTINNSALVMGAFATMLLPLVRYLPTESTNPFLFFGLYAVLFGLSIACFVSLRSILIVDLLGLGNLTNAVGLLLLFAGVAAFIGSPLAGILKEGTGDYDATFYVAGSLLLISGLMSYPLRAINNWEKKQNQEKFRRFSDRSGSGDNGGSA